MTPRLRRYDSFQALPPAYAALREQLAQAGLFGTPDWFALLMQHSFNARDRLWLYGVEDAASGRPLMLAPLRLGRDDPGVPGARIAGSASHPENFCVAAFAFDAALEQPEDVAAALFRALREGDPALCDAPVDVVRLWPLASDSELGDILYMALLDAGFRVQVYANSYNRFETTAGLSHADYFAQRSANLRYSARRRRRALERSGTLELLVVRGGEALEGAIAEYRAVSLASWKKPHSMLSSDAIAMIRLAAEQGALRLGLLRVGGVPAAVQFWIVSAGVAHCVRLAYAEAFKKAAVGVVLTDYMLAQVMDGDRVERVDFGFGREDYKGGWMKEARLYVGLLAFNPRSWRGRWQALRHIDGQPLKRRVKAALTKLGLLRPDEVDPREYRD